MAASEESPQKFQIYPLQSIPTAERMKLFQLRAKVSFKLSANFENQLKHKYTKNSKMLYHLKFTKNHP